MLKIIFHSYFNSFGVEDATSKSKTFKSRSLTTRSSPFEPTSKYALIGTNISGSNKYKISKGKDLTEAHLDWTQLTITDLTYEDEASYTVEFNFSSGVSIRHTLSVDVTGIANNEQYVNSLSIK